MRARLRLRAVSSPAMRGYLDSTTSTSDFQVDGRTDGNEQRDERGEEGERQVERPCTGQDDASHEHSADEACDLPERGPGNERGAGRPDGALTRYRDRKGLTDICVRKEGEPGQ